MMIKGYVMSSLPVPDQQEGKYYGVREDLRLNRPYLS
jgi:hypothetical protein